MLTVLMLLYFFSCFIIVGTQIVKINKITLNYGVNVFSKEKGLTKAERNTIVKALFIAVGFVVGGFILVGFIAYLLNPNDFQFFS